MFTVFRAVCSGARRGTVPLLIWLSPSLVSFEDLKRQVLDRVDIVDLVSEHVTLKRSGSRWVGLCPFHEEKTPSFTVSPDRAAFKCFGCGKGGDAFSFVQFRENVDFTEAMRILADRAGVEFTGFRRESAGGPGRVDVAKVNTWAVRFFRDRLLDTELGRSARQYLERRGVSNETSERFGLGLACDGPQGLRRAASGAGIDEALLTAADLIRPSDRGDSYETFRNRLMFPIRDATNRVVGFGGRTLVDDRAKYINSRQTSLFDKGRGLYGVELARDAIQKRGRAVVVEGYMDCIAAHQAGFGEVVATLGTAMTEAQVDLLRRYSDEIILLFDSDKAGVAAAERAIQVALPRCVKVRLARTPEGTDPSDFLADHGVDEFSDGLNSAVDALEFKWIATRQRFHAGESESQQREAVLDFLRIVASAADAAAVDVIRRGQMVMQVAHLLQMGRRDVEQLMSRLRPKNRREQAQAEEGRGDHQSSKPPSGEQGAWTRWLEFVLNDSSLLASDGSMADVARIADPRDRRIGLIVCALWKERGAFRPVDVSVKCDAPEDAQRVTELAGRGAAREGFSGWFELAVQCIQSAIKNETTERRRDECVGVPEGKQPSNELLAAVGHGASEHRSFAPRRMTRNRNET